MASSNEPYIRPVDYPKDRPQLDHIFRTTCGASLKYEPAWSIGSYLWCHPYPIICPQTCFVLDDGSGKAVGYVLGTPATVDFAKRWKPEFLTTLPGETLDNYERDAKDDTAKGLLSLLKHPDGMECFALPGLVEQWPGHLHIDILPVYQAKGWGGKMIKTLLEALAKQGSKAVHLGMEHGNEGALKFYLKLGFERYADVVARDGGKGPAKEPGALYLVKTI